jgi:hypothetical protein
MESVNRVQEDECPDPFIEVFAAPAKGIQGLALLLQVLKGKAIARVIERTASNGGIGTDNKTDQAGA